MPKFHDKCQILIEELWDLSKRNMIKDPPQVLALVLHAVETYLHEKHPDALVISQHLWILFDELELKGYFAATEGARPIAEGEISIEIACDEAVNLARRMFPPPKRHIF